MTKYLSISNKIREAAEQLNKISARQGMLRYIEKFVNDNDLPAKNWPPYVKNEMFKHIKISVGRIGDIPPKKGVPHSLSNYKPLMEEFMWEYSSDPEIIKIDIDLDNFDEKTQADLSNRIKKTTPFIPKDIERHEYQKSLLQNIPDEQLINKEPVILKQLGFNKYQLVEGWHRTAQLISEARRRGLLSVNYKAYIGKKGDFFDKLNYYLKKFNDYLRNTPVYKSQEEMIRREKQPYRKVLKELKKERGKVRQEIKTPIF